MNRQPGDDLQEDELDDTWVEVDDPTDPNHPDYDLSSAAPAYLIEEQKPWFIRRWVMIIAAVLIIGGILLPYFLRLG